LKVLLTGANGFVGSHVLDSLRRRKVPVVLLLRQGSSRSFIQAHLDSSEIRTGSILDVPSLSPALEGVTHVIHCAGLTKACRPSEFSLTNDTGTRNLVEAVNRHKGTVRRLIHLSSLAAGGPAAPNAPAREHDPPRPVSEYGLSKLAAETAIRQNCRVDHVILRPPGVYGPRDHGFLGLFKAVLSHILPRPVPQQAISLVYASDLAEAIVACLDHPRAPGRTFYVASPEIVTSRHMAEEIAALMKTWTIPCPLHAAVLWPVCLAHQLRARFTGKPALLNLQKFAELRAPGWVCDPALLRHDIGFECLTRLRHGLTVTIDWYRTNGWL
jgi:nucleoside-diphosphate-sugar epimerase